MKKNISKLAGLVSAGAVYLSAAGGVMAAGISLCSSNDLMCSTFDFQKVITQVINGLLFVAFIAALVFLIYGGIRWIISGGDKEGTAKAKGTVTAALVGLVIVLGAWILINIILQFFGIGSGLSGLTFPSLGK